MLPLSLERRLSKLSSNEKIFNDSIPSYQEALIKAGYNLQPQVNLPETRPEKNNSQQLKRKVTWFNPWYSKNVSTKVGKFSLSWIDHHKYFPPQHKLYKFFNRNNVKISYSCLPNIKSIINAHNGNILCLSPTIGRSTCNCINISQCPLQQRCLSNNILYQASSGKQSDLGQSLKAQGKVVLPFLCTLFLLIFDT